MLQKVASAPAKMTYLAKFTQAATSSVAVSQGSTKELLATPMTDQYFKELQESYEDFNKGCAQELVDMNQNVIQNIISRGGDAGWEHSPDYDWLKKSFEFSSFEQATAFMQSVGVKAENIDHHPEWYTSEGGTVVNVTLTSHFADNKVTRLDFQLAEILNEEYAVASSTFKMHTYFDKKEWASIKIAFGSLALGAFLLRMYMGHNLGGRKSVTKDAETFYAQNGVIQVPFGSETQIEAQVKLNMDNMGLQRVQNQKIFF